MELVIKKTFLILAFALSISFSTDAQSLGIGATFNHTSNGINLFYSNYIGRNNRWGYDAGIRITVNTYSLNKNKQNFIFYQTGYAHKFLEYFGLNLKGFRKLIEYKNFRVDAQLNLFTVYQSLLYRDNTYDYNTNIVIKSEEIFWKPAIVFESTLGIQLQYKILPNITITTSSGLGIAFLNYQYESGWNRTTNNNVIWMRDALKPNKDRGDYDFIGLDGLPIISIGIKYKLNK